MMNKTIKLMASTALALTMTTTAMADEFRIDRLFVVGDSLSDAGTYSNTGRAATAQRIAAIQAAGGTVPPELLQAQANNIRYRFTNDAADGTGGVYAEVLASELGIDLLPYTINTIPTTGTLPATGTVGGTNYAQGGSRVAEQPGVKQSFASGISTVPIDEQVAQLLQDRPSFDDGDLVILWGGNNDVLFQYGAARLGQPIAASTAAVETAADEMVGLVNQVLARGASNVVVVTVPDIGSNTPFGAAARNVTVQGRAGNTVLTENLVNPFNTRLINGVAGRVTVVNSNEVLSDILKTPERYGFAAGTATQLSSLACTTTDAAGDPTALPCVAGATTINDGQNGNSLIFADSVHPTSAAHRVLAEAAFGALVAIGQAGAIPVATISGLRQQSIGLEQRLNLGAFFINDDDGNRIRRPVGNVEVYGGGEVGFYESDEQQVVPGFDAATQVLKVAADVMVTDNVLLGIGGSVDHGQVEYDGGRGGFDSRLYVGGVFGVAQIIPGVYVNGFLGGGLIDVYDIDRSFNTTNIAGNVVSTNSYSADTDGTYFIARTNVGAVLPVGNGFAVNPSVGFAYEKVDIDGYTESARGGAPGSLAARVGDTEYEGHRGTLALAGFYRPPSDPTWTFGLRASYEHDFSDDDVEVPFAVGSSPTNVQVAPRPDDSYGLLSATVVKELTHNTSFSLMGSTNVLQDGVDGYTLSLVFKHSL